MIPTKDEHFLIQTIFKSMQTEKITFSETEYIGSCAYLSGKAIDQTYSLPFDLNCCDGTKKTCGKDVSCATVCGSTSNTPGI